MQKLVIIFSFFTLIGLGGAYAGNLDDRGQVFEGIKSLNNSSSDKTLSVTDDVVLADSTTAFTIDLPDATTVKGKVYRVKKTDSTLNAVTIDPYSTQTVDGNSTTTLNTEKEALTIVSDGANWSILEHRIPENWSSSLTFTPNGFGTLSSSTFFSRRVGDSLEVTFMFEAGTLNASTLATISLPSGLSIDTAKVQGDQNGLFGHAHNSNSGGTSGIFLQNVGDAIFYDSSDATKVYIGFYNLSDASGKVFGTTNTTDLVNNSAQISGKFVVPISGWQP